MYNILYTNARSILNKIDDLRTSVTDLQPDFVCICESFVKHDISEAYLSLDGYQLIVRQDGRDTVEGKCRGLLIYVREGINAAKIESKDFEGVIEMAGVTVPWGRGESLSIILVYRPPTVPETEADQGNTERLCRVMREVQGPQVWVGDFNMHIDWERGYSPVAGEDMFLHAVQDLFLGAVGGLSHAHQGWHPRPSYDKQARAGGRGMLRRISCSWSRPPNALS